MTSGISLKDRGGSYELTAPDNGPGGKTTSSGVAGLGICEVLNFIQSFPTVESGGS